VHQLNSCKFDLGLSFRNLLHWRAHICATKLFVVYYAEGCVELAVSISAT